MIKRTLAPLSRAAVDGFIELIVVCNGCTDDTADVARSVPGVRVVELEQGSKPAALNAGDEAATLWPRLYLDADIQISAAAVLAVLDRLAQGDVLVARPDSRYDSRGASALVRSYYRARQRIPQHKLAMWGAGAYGLSAKGHQRFGAFPTVTGDDLYVDTRFDAHEKAVVATDPSVVKTPADAKSLLAILRRQPPRRRRAVGRRAWTGRAGPEYGSGHRGRGCCDDPRSSIGGRCGGVPRDGVRRTVALPDGHSVGARREQPIERVTSVRYGLRSITARKRLGGNADCSP